MKKLLSTLLITACALLASGCESDNERQVRLDREHQIKLAKISSGQDVIEQEMRHERSMAYIQRPVAPGAYTDYRGNTQYGYWNSGSWAWNNPQSPYAMQSRQYVDYQMATGVVATAVLTQALFNSNNSSGWQQKNVTVNNYTSTTGKPIDKATYTTRNKAVTTKYKTRAKATTVKSTVVKPAVKKAPSKWDSKRKAAPTYAKGGFKNTFEKNKQKSTYAKNNTKPKVKKSAYSGPKTTYKKPKTTYKKSSYSSKSRSSTSSKRRY
jgi:hypothetical protein